jgi:Tfp pilus assembly protein PilO
MNRRAVFLGVVVAVGVLLLWWVLVFSPLGSDLDDARDDLDNAERQGQSLSAERQQLQDLQDRSPEIEAQLGRLAAAIPDQPAQADFISGLNDIADESGITWQSVTMQEPTPGTAGQPPTIPVQIEIEGGFFQVLDYLNRLEDPEAVQRLMVIDNVTMDAGGEGTPDPDSGLTSSGGDLTVSLTARIFSQSSLDSSPGTPPGGGSTNGGGSSSSDNGVVN